MLQWLLCVQLGPAGVAAAAAASAAAAAAAVRGGRIEVAHMVPLSGLRLQMVLVPVGHCQLRRRSRSGSSSCRLHLSVHGRAAAELAAELACEAFL